MWWVPLAAACCVGLLIGALSYWQRQRQHNGAQIYRARFLQVIAQLDSVTRVVNQLGHQLVRDRGPQEDNLVNYFEGTLRLLETLLAAIKKIPPFGNDPKNLDSVFFLVKDCQDRVFRVQKAFHDAAKGKTVKLEALYGHAKKKEPTGCYFCSRPVIIGRFFQVRVRVDGSVREVLSCKICREELEHTKKVKVLYFMKDGRPVHWSESPNYHPSEDYWNINKRAPVRRTQKLELIYSAHQEPDGG